MSKALGFMVRSKRRLKAELAGVRICSGVYAPECICSAGLVNSVITALLRNLRRYRKTRSREYVEWLLSRFIVPAGVVRLGGGEDIPVELYCRWLVRRTKEIVLNECLDGAFPRGLSRFKVFRILEDLIK